MIVLKTSHRLRDIAMSMSSRNLKCFYLVKLRSPACSAKFVISLDGVSGNLDKSAQDCGQGLGDEELDMHE